MADIYHKVSTGEAAGRQGVAFRNVQFQRKLVDVCRDFDRRQTGLGPAGATQTDLIDSDIWVANLSWQQIEQFGPTGLGDLASAPISTTDMESTQNFYNETLFLSADPVAASPFAIALEPIPPPTRYMATSAGTLAEPPGNGWQKMSTRSTYAGGATYIKGDAVISGSTTYVYINATPAAGNAPPNATYWQAISDKKIFIAGTSYAIGDVVGFPEIGRVLMAGVVKAWVNVTDATHKWAAPASGNYDYLTSRATPGPARIIWATGGTGQQWTLVNMIGLDFVDVAITDPCDGQDKKITVLAEEPDPCNPSGDGSGSGSAGGGACGPCDTTPDSYCILGFPGITNGTGDGIDCTDADVMASLAITLTRDPDPGHSVVSSPPDCTWTGVFTACRGLSFHVGLGWVTSSELLMQINGLVMQYSVSPADDVDCNAPIVMIRVGRALDLGGGWNWPDTVTVYPGDCSGTPEVDFNSAAVCSDATTLLIHGANFLPTGNTVALTPAGTVSGMTVNGTGTLITATVSGLAAGDLFAVVTNSNGSSGAPKKVATIVDAPTITVNTADVPQATGPFTFTGTNFVPGHTTVTMSSGTWATTSVSSTSITGIFFDAPDLGALTATVTTDCGTDSEEVANIVDGGGDGSTCLEAIVFAIGDTLSPTIPAGQTLWYKSNSFTALTHMHISVSLMSTGVSVTVYDGATCGGLNMDVDGLTAGCQNILPTTGLLFVAVTNSDVNPESTVFTIATGDCP